MLTLKRAVLACAATLALATLTLYYGAPLRSKEILSVLHRSLSGLEENTVNSAQHRIHYLDTRSAARSADAAVDETPVVLLHGIFAEYRVLAPDLPGFGESSRHAGHPYDYAAQVAHLGALLDTLRIPRVHLAGSSMGGTIAALYAIQHPERVASVAFIGAPHGIRSPQQSTVDRLIDAGQRPLVAHDADAFAAMMALVFERRPLLPYPVLFAAERKALDDAADNARLWDAQLRDRYLLGEKVGALQAPLLALWGAGDRVFDVSGTQTLQGLLPNARVSTLPGVGHLPMMEAPGDTARRYLEFLRALRPDSQTRDLVRR
jgi:pimeloyl-ACP methyl ester carboxylesterase